MQINRLHYLGYFDHRLQINIIYKGENQDTVFHDIVNAFGNVSNKKENINNCFGFKFELFYYTNVF